MNDAMTEVAVAALAGLCVITLTTALGFFDYPECLDDKTRLCSWQPRLCARIFTGMVYVGAAAFAIGAGVWAGSRASLPRPHNEISGQQRLRAVAQRGIFSADGILARMRLAPGYAPLGSIEVNGDSFPVKKREPYGPTVSSLRGGFADVFDQDGRLVRRYVAIEHSDGSWQLMRYLRRPAVSE